MNARDRLLTLRRDLDTAIASNRAYRGDTATMGVLSGLTTQLERWRHFVIVGLEQPAREHDVAMRVGPNWSGPKIADHIDQSRRIRDAWTAPVEESVRVEREAA